VSRLTVGVLAVLLVLSCGQGAQAEEPVEYPIVVGWHQVVADGKPIKRENGPVVHLTDFEDMLVRLRENGIRTLTMDEYCAAVREPDPPRDAILITVDDGYESVYTVLYPLLRKYDMHLTSFVITDNVGKENEVNPHQPWLNWEQCRELSQSGLVDIEAHAARSHQKIKGSVGGKAVAGAWIATRLFDPATGYEEPREAYEARVREEFVNARTEILENVGRAPKAFCWPFGVTNEFAIEACRQAGFEVSFTLDKGWADPSCRRRYHFPERAEQAFALLEAHPERAALATEAPEGTLATESEKAPESHPEAPADPAPPRMDRADAATPKPLWSAPVASLLVAAAAGTLVWGVLYLLLFRGSDGW